MARIEFIRLETSAATFPAVVQPEIGTAPCVYLARLVACPRGTGEGTRRMVEWCRELDADGIWVRLELTPEAESKCDHVEGVEQADFEGELDAEFARIDTGAEQDGMAMVARLRRFYERFDFESDVDEDDELGPTMFRRPRR